MIRVPFLQRHYADGFSHLTKRFQVRNTIMKKPVQYVAMSRKNSPICIQGSRHPFMERTIRQIVGVKILFSLLLLFPSLLKIAPVKPVIMLFRNTVANKGKTTRQWTISKQHNTSFKITNIPWSLQGN